MGYINILQLIVISMLLFIYQKKLGENSIYIVVAIVIAAITNIVAKILNDVFAVSNIFIFIIFINLISFLLFFIYFLNFMKHRFTKMIQRIITFVFVLVSIFLISWQGKNFFHEFPTNFYFFETILLLGSISLFLYETFHSNIVLNIKSYFPFWVSICLIMVYVGLLPLLFFVQQMGVSISADLFRLIMLFVNFMGYSILIVGILNSKKIKE